MPADGQDPVQLEGLSEVLRARRGDVRLSLSALQPLASYEPSGATQALQSACPAFIGAVQLRSGMWVMRGDQIGIAIIAVGGIIEFHAVDVDGDTASVSIVDPAELRQASWLEIPERRRPTAAVAAGLGYEVNA